MMQKPGLGALAVVARDDHVILVKRGKDPDKGLWGFPGGSIELGEPIFEAARRELAEETGVTAQPCQMLHTMDAIRWTNGELQFHFVLVAVVMTYISGEPVAADDAADARWASRRDIKAGAYPLCNHVSEVAQKAFALVDSAN